LTDVLADGKTVGGRILIVDDDNTLRGSIAKVLREEGYSVDEAADGASALARVDHARPDAILLDVMMPGMNGRQFLEELRSRDDDKIPVVVMTALQGLGTDRIVRLGADDLVEKPFDVDDLLNKIALALFRSGEYATLVDRPVPPRTSAPAPRPAPTHDVGAGVVLIVTQDREMLAQIDGLLGAQGYTLVSLSRVSSDLPRLACALEPRAILMEISQATVDGNLDGMETLRRLRQEPALDTVSILVCAPSQQALATIAAEVADLFAVSVSHPCDVGRVVDFVNEPPRHAHR
jgi:CheY-like chemotaxis protein